MDTLVRKSDFVTVGGVRLHYLDWGGEGPVLLFLAGLGCSAYIFDHFAPRFADHFHVMGLTRRGHGDSDCPETGYDPDSLAGDVRGFMDALGIDRVILVGHSMANVELCHFTALYPERVLRLVFLEAAYNRTAPAYKAMIEKNPVRAIPVPGQNDAQYTIEDLAASIRRSYPSLAAIWGPVMDEEIRHVVTKDSEGKMVEKMPDEISGALSRTLAEYSSEDAALHCPVLSIYAINDGANYLSQTMTEDQRTAVAEFYESVRPQLQREIIEQFRSDVPQAKIIVIPAAHHYCFIQQEEIVFNEMREFLLEG